ncbi:MAG: hypothetical protein JNK15_07330 [Planctomycetes bacterium]|nr:hypothetical protein [Planctomycetota bacterium]
MNDSFDDDLDAKLRAVFVPPPASELTAMAQRVAAAPPPSAWRWYLAAAAVLLVAGLVFAWPRGARGPEGHDGAELGALFVAAYEHAARNGFGSGSCCSGDSDLAAVCEQKFAVKLGFAGKDGCAVHGCYCGLPTGGAVAVLAQVGGDPVGVFVVPRARDPRPCLPKDCPLHLSRRELGPLVLYALSSQAKAAPLDQFALLP